MELKGAFYEKQKMLLSSLSGNSKGFRSSVSGTIDKDQIYVYHIDYGEYLL